MLTLKLAALNLTRHTKRTLMTAVAIAVGLALFILMDSILQGWYETTEREYVQYTVASGWVVKESWWKEKERLPLSESIENTETVVTLLDKLGLIYAPRTEFPADMIFYEDPYPQSGVYPTRVVAIDPRRDPKVFALSAAMGDDRSEGLFLSEGSDGIVVGSALATKLHMEVGYPVRLQFQGKLGYQEIMNSRVIGIVHTGSPLVNLNGVYISMDAAEYYLQMEGAVTGYAVKAPAGAEGVRAMAELQRQLPGEYRLLAYDELAADFTAMQDVEDSFASLFYLIIFVIAAVGVTNTMMISIFERRREIGMMRAQGFPDRRIYLLFLMEAAGIGGVGTIAGLSLAALVNIPLVNRGFDYSIFLRSDAELVDFGSIAMSTTFIGVWSPSAFLTSGALAIAISGAVSLFPARRMLKEDVAANLRSD